MSLLDIKNPIMLARKIYDKANVQMGMSRVPPNFLAGEGAKDFAWEHGLVIIPEEALISPVALERYQVWAAEVKDYENETLDEVTDPWIRRPVTPLDTRLERLERASQPGAHPGSDTADEETGTLSDPTLFADVKGRQGASLEHQTRKKAKLANSHLPVQPASLRSHLGMVAPMAAPMAAPIPPIVNKTRRIASRTLLAPSPLTSTEILQQDLLLVVLA